VNEMSNISVTITELAKIGNNYPTTAWAGLFARHTHQFHAKQLSLLATSTENMEESAKIIKVQETIHNIYSAIWIPGTLIEEIHTCLCNGVNFAPYKNKMDEINIRIEEGNQTVIESEGYDVQLSLNMHNYREALEAVYKAPIHTLEKIDSWTCD